MIFIKYKLYENAENDHFNVVENVMKNRGIENPNEYFNISVKDEIDYNKLDYINDAVNMFDKHFCNNDKIGILIDEDVDGFTSAATMYNYIKEMDNDYPIQYIMHNKPKSHGLSDDVFIPNDIKLLIIPDASSNDILECKKLKEQNIDIIVLDHHECDIKNDYAIVVNNQLSENYSNKNLSGVGVVYKFCQALDDCYMQDYANNFIDLVALGLIGDVMDMRSYETKYLVDKGLQNITNKCFKSLITSQEYSMNNIVNIHNIQWYIVPIMNAMIRVGSYEDKELLFKALIEKYEEFDYKKRGVGIIKENIFDRVARLCKNAKSRQTRIVDKGFDELSKKVISENNNDKVIIIDSSNDVDNSLTGLVCMKLADKFDKPCILLNKKANNSQGNDNIFVLDNKNQNGEILFGGSARNVRNSNCENFRDTINETKCFNFARGHSSAFGVEIKQEMIDKAREKLNALFKNISNDKIYFVDFILEEGDIDARLIKDLDSLSNYYAQGIEEPKVAAKINIYKEQIEIIGKDKNTISYTNADGIKFIFFKCDEKSELLKWATDLGNNANISVEVVGKPCINIYNGIATPQFIVDDFNMLEFIENEVFERGDDIWN